MRIGLLGGSFNPAHEGHLQIARLALKLLQLDQVWLLVSPGNPLKARSFMMPFAQRLASAEQLADGRRIIATDWEFRLKERYTWRTIMELKRRFPRTQFIWLMGSDGFAHFTHWRHWQRIAKSVPMAVFPRPSSVRTALKGAAAAVLRHNRGKVGQSVYHSYEVKLPYWVFLITPQNPISSTMIRHSTQENTA